MSFTSNIKNEISNVEYSNSEMMSELSAILNIGVKISSDKFEIFHYRDAKFEGVPVHQHDFYEVYFFINGNVEYSIFDKSMSVSALASDCRAM